MKKKTLIELIIYMLIAIIGIILLFTYKPKEIEIHIPSGFEVEALGGDKHASLSVE